jgi:hypothetical protein
MRQAAQGHRDRITRRTIVVGVPLAVGVAIALRMLVGGASGPDGDSQPTPCFENAAIRVTAAPPAVTWPI